MVCLNDGRGTRLDVLKGSVSVLDLTLVSSNLAGKCEWEIAYETKIGSDHYPIYFRVLLQENMQ